MQADQSVVCPVIIGRDAPLAAGLHVLEQAREALGGTLLVSGEAGIGKSRLVRALVEAAHQQRFVILQGACFEADRTLPYAPILDLIRALTASSSTANAAQGRGAAADEPVTQFAVLRSVFPGAAPRRVRVPEEDRRRLFQTFADSIKAIASHQPVLLVIEDVHWSDDATLDLLLHLAHRIGSASVALALTFRSDEVGPRLAKLLADLDRARSASEIALRPLAVGDVTAMLQSIFSGQVAFGSAFIGALHSLTEGNPFFVEEMLKALLVAGDIERTPSGWRARALAHVHVPRTATEAVARRLDRLSADARGIASIASVAGRRFDFGLLQSVTQRAERELLRLVKELVSAQLVVEETADRFAFRHALTCEAVLAGLLARERVALHKAIATALEQAYDVRPDDGALAYHAFEAGEWETAGRHARRAAFHALALSAPREALQHLDRAATATERAGRRVEASLFISRGRTHETLGNFQQANDDFIAVLAKAQQESDQRAAWEALHALGMLWAARDYERAGSYRREALDAARTIGDPPLIARSLNRVGNWFANREEPYSGIPSHNEALRILEQAGDLRGVAETVDLLAMAHHIAGAQDTAVQLYERCIGLFATLDDRRGLSNALAVLSVCGPSYHASPGRVAISLHTDEVLGNERAVRLSSEIAWRAGEAFARYLVGDCLGWRGDWVRAIAAARESLAIAEEIEHLEWQSGAHRVLGNIALDMFDLTDAVHHLESAHTTAQVLGSATWTRWTGAPLAIALARAGHVDRASRVLDRVDRLVTARTDRRDEDTDRRTLGERFLDLARAEVAMAAGNPATVLQVLRAQDARGAPRVGLVRAEAMAAMEQWDDALSSLRTARASAYQQDARPILWRIAACEGAIHLARRHRLEARESFDAARTVADSLAAGLNDAGTALFRAAVDHLAPPPPEPTALKAAKKAYGGLTRRERDTAALVAQGKSNRAIARLLGIGERTVEGHVTSILTRLGFSSRAQIAVWAARQGLAAPDAVRRAAKR